MFVDVPICLKESVQDVSPLSSRIQSILIETQNDKIMLLNTYFPTDPRCNDFGETDLLLDRVIDAGVLHLPDNLSDHFPVICIMNSNMVAKHSSQANLAKTNTHPCWKLTSDSQKLGFYSELQRMLQKLDVPSCVTACTTGHCKNEEHKQEIDSVMLDVLHSLEFAADIQISKPKSVNPNKPAKNTIPKCNEEITPYKEDAYISGTQSGHQLENHSITTCI